jgi:hypothetical protein
VVAKHRKRLLEGKQATQKLDMQIFVLKKIHEAKVGGCVCVCVFMEQYQIQISNRFAAFKNLDVNTDINRV